MLRGPKNTEIAIKIRSTKCNKKKTHKKVVKHETEQNSW